MTDALFRELCKPKTLKIGWHLAQLDSRDDFVEDPLRNLDFASQLDVRLQYIAEQLASGRFRPKHLLEVDIPKSALTVRPGNVLPIEEAIILHAIVYLIAPKLDPLLSKQVYSYRLHRDWRRRIVRGRSLFQDDDVEAPFLKRATIKTFDPMDSWYVAWPQFDRARQRAITDSGCTHLAKADIAAYFENIDLRLLEDLLRQRLRFEPKLLALIFRIFSTWTRDTAAGVPVGRGLPQGNDVSSFLANLYLLPLDRALSRFCGRSGSKWYRYVDDLDILTGSYETARQALILTNSVLRSIHLNLQGSKTRILSGADLEVEYKHQETEQVSALLKEIGNINGSDRAAAGKRKTLLATAAPLTTKFTRNLPGAIRELSSKDSRLLRRLFTLHGSQGSAKLRRTAIACLREQPERRLLEKALRYLQTLDYKLHAGIADDLLEIAGNGTEASAFQTALIIQSIGQLHPRLPDNLAAQILRLALRRRNGWLVRQKSLEALFNLPCEVSATERVATQMMGDEHPWVRRAAAALVLRGGVRFVREQMGHLVFQPDVSMQMPALMWRKYADDSEFRLKEMKRLQAVRGDFQFMRNIRAFWLLGRTCKGDEVAQYERLLDGFGASESQIVIWHIRSLRNPEEGASRS